MRLIVLLPALLLIWVPLSLAAMVSIPFGGRKKLLFHTILSLWARASCRILGIAVDVRMLNGALNTEESYIIIANHPSIIDTLVLLSALPVRSVWLAKRSVFFYPFIGQVIWLGGFIPVSKNKRAVAKRLRGIDVKLRQRHCSLLYFAEGGVSWNGSVGAFRLGAFRTAIKAQLPVLPVAISGTHELKPRGRGLLPRRGRVTVTMGKPIKPEGSAQMLAKSARDAVLTLKALGACSPQPQGL